MDEIEKVCDIVDRIHEILDRSEVIAWGIMKTLEELETQEAFCG